MKKVRVQSYQHIQQQICLKKIDSKNTPKKLQSIPTKHLTESSFLLVSDPLEDLNFRFFGLSFFPINFHESRVTHFTETSFLHVLDPPDPPNCTI